MPAAPLSPPRRRATARTALAAAALLVACGALTGCDLLAPGRPDHGPSTSPEPEIPQTYPEVTRAVTVARGETIRIALPNGNPSVGDQWGVVSSSEPAVAHAEVHVEPKEKPSPGAPPMVGGPAAFSVQIRGDHPGSTTIRVLYCTRSVIKEGCDQSHGRLKPPVEPREYRVTVTE